MGPRYCTHAQVLLSCSERGHGVAGVTFSCVEEIRCAVGGVDEGICCETHRLGVSGCGLLAACRDAARQRVMLEADQSSACLQAKHAVYLPNHTPQDTTQGKSTAKIRETSGSSQGNPAAQLRPPLSCLPNKTTPSHVTQGNDPHTIRCIRDREPTSRLALLLPRQAPGVLSRVL